MNGSLHGPAVPGGNQRVVNAVIVALALLAGQAGPSAVSAAAPTLTAIATAGGYTTDPTTGDYVFAKEINNRAEDLVPSPGQLGVGFDVQQTVATYPRSGENIVVFARTGAWAGPGTLRVYVQSEGHSDTTHPLYYSFGRADAVARFTDTFVVQPSARHPAGVFVPLALRLAVERLVGAGPGAEVSSLATVEFRGPDTWNPFDPSGNPLGQNGTLYSSLHFLDTTKDNDTASEQAEAQFLVGATYTITGSATAFVTTQAGNTWYGFLRDSVAAVDAFHTTRCFVWSDDPDVVLTTASGVAYAPPVALSVRRSGGHVVVTWPGSAPGYRLFATRSLSAPEWTEVSPAPVVTDGRWTAIVPADGVGQYFRLVKQP